MPRSYTSFHEHEDANDGDFPSSRQSLAPSTRSPTNLRRLRSSRTSEVDLRSRMPSRSMTLDETSMLLGNSEATSRNYQSSPATPRRANGHAIERESSSRALSLRHTPSGSFGARLASALSLDRRKDNEMKDSFHNDRVWYDQFTSTDWVHDSIADAFRVKALRSRRDFRGRLWSFFDGAQGWILAAIIGCVVACMAYFVDVTETAIFDLKEGYCKRSWYVSRKTCCLGFENCSDWLSWSQKMHIGAKDNRLVDFGMFVLWVMALSGLSSVLTLMTRTVVPSTISLSTLDENLGAETHKRHKTNDDVYDGRSPSPAGILPGSVRKDTVYYSAAGSGVAEVKVILSGFVLHGYLGLKTLVFKTFGLVLSVASGLSIGKEGPYVHIATCIGNVACRFFPKYNHNDGKRREVLSASAAGGIAVAFGAPIGGVLFSLEEVSYYFPPKTLFRTFFCCIVAALFLKFLNPYGTGVIVMFEVRYTQDWRYFEMIFFVILGVLGGAAGALFIKASRFWAQTFRRLKLIKGFPLFEVLLVALITGLISFWNRLSKLAVTQLMFELASPCKEDSERSITGLCPRDKDEIGSAVLNLLIAFVIKSFLTIITFGIKVPAGIYVPSMVVGGLMGRMVGHGVQYLTLRFPHFPLFASCPANGGPESCVTPGVYALIAAGATMCGVTRLSVTLAVILFELTGSLDHVLPFSIGVLVSKWTADAIEPLSIYDLLTDMNSYPFLDNKFRPIFTSELRDITTRKRPERVIDISASPLILARELRRKLDYLHRVGELDGGLAITQHGVLKGLIPAPDLEYALDKIEDESHALCLMAANVRWEGSDSEDENQPADPTDLTPYIDPAPVSLEIRSPMDLVYECFVKLGLRYICVLQDGQYAGMVHKKTFVRYVKELEAGHSI